MVKSLVRISWGADPEFFFKSKDGKIVEATKLIKPNEKNILIKPYSDTISTDGEGCTLISDGMQGELNIKPCECRANIGNNLKKTFIELKKFCNANNVLLSFDESVVIPRKQFENMDKSCKQFGCAPSFNTYIKREDKISIIKANPTTYNFRSAGGHLHLGLNETFKGWKAKTDELVRVLDIVVGNTCVLVDRNPLQVERRKNYGKAGEYRTPTHGLEYRTLSNFWLKDYRLQSMVMQLAKVAITIVHEGREKELLSLVNEKDIRRAINKNDASLAWKNLCKIKNFMKKEFGVCYIENCFDSAHIEKFYSIISDYKLFYEKMGIADKTDEELIDKWTHMAEGHGTGFESFLEKLKL